MTKRGSFKRAVRREAQQSGRTYTQALSGIRRDQIRERMSAAWRADGLASHFEQLYDIDVASISPIARHGGGVLRVDRRDGPAWVARVFPQVRGIDAVRGDADILRFLERHDFPAERCAHPEPVSSYEDQGVLVTTFVDGEPCGFAVEDEFALADLYGRLHALPPGEGGAARPGGAFGFDPRHAGRPVEDLAAAVSFLDAVADDVPAEHRPLYDYLRAESERVDTCEGLPEALTAPEMYATNVRVGATGTRTAIDWKSAGRGPRLAAFASLLEGGAGVAGKEDEMVDAIVRGYSAHVRLESEELARLEGAMRLQPFYLGAHTFWSATASDRDASVANMWVRDTDTIKRIAAKTVAASVEAR